MSNLFWLTDMQITHLKSYFPKFHGKPCVNDRRVPKGVSVRHRAHPNRHLLALTVNEPGAYRPVPGSLRPLTKGSGTYFKFISLAP